MSHAITYEKIRFRDMVIDPRVQRILDPRKVAKIRDEGFNPVALGTPEISRRSNGDNVVINAQHRRQAAIDEGYELPVTCKVHHGLTLSQEASLFRLLNAQTTPSVIAQFLVRVVEGDKTALVIDAVVTSHGWQVSQSSSDGAISAIAALERIYTTAAGTKPEGDYEDVLDQVLTVITRAWGRDRNAVHKVILEGIAQLYGRLGNVIDSEKLVADLMKHDPVELIGKAKQMQSLQGGRQVAAFAKVLVGIHNNRKRVNLLPEWVWTR